MNKGELEISPMDNGIRFAFVIGGGGFARGKEVASFWLSQEEAEAARDKIGELLTAKG